MKDSGLLWRASSYTGVWASEDSKGPRFRTTIERKRVQHTVVAMDSAGRATGFVFYLNTGENEPLTIDDTITVRSVVFTTITNGPYTEVFGPDTGSLLVTRYKVKKIIGNVVLARSVGIDITPGTLQPDIAAHYAAERACDAGMCRYCGYKIQEDGKSFCSTLCENEYDALMKTKVRV